MDSRTKLRMRVSITVYRVRNGPASRFTRFLLAVCRCSRQHSVHQLSIKYILAVHIFSRKCAKAIGGELKLIYILACSLGFHGVTFECSILTKIAIFKMKPV